MMLSACRWNFTLACLAVVTLALGGCGVRGERCYPVHGRVTLDDGTPLVAGRVSFESTAKRISAEGYTDTNGEFSMTTYNPGDGALEGEHRIVVTPPPPRPIDKQRHIEEVSKFEGVKPEDIEKMQNEPAPPLIDRKYAEFETSGLKFVVEPKSGNICNLTVERLKP